MHDAAGNITQLPKAGDETTSLSAKYDAWNRLKEVSEEVAPEYWLVRSTYWYDGLGRLVSTGALPGTIEYCYNENYQVVESQDDAFGFEGVRQYVWSQRYVDAPVMVYVDGSDGQGAVSKRTYVMQDANFNVTGILEGSTGAVTHRFTYTPYGQRSDHDADWSAATTWVDFMLGHQGLMLDYETGMYYNRARFYHPTLGRFIQRDPLGYVDGGSVYEYVTSRPLIERDPSGSQAYVGGLPSRYIGPVPIGVPTGPVPIDVKVGTGDRWGFPIELGAGTNVSGFLLAIGGRVRPGECLRELTIAAHGNPYEIDVHGRVNGSSPPIVAGGIGRRDNTIMASNIDAFGRGLRAVANFCQPCQITLQSCNVGLGRLPQALADATGCEVRAPGGYSYPTPRVTKCKVVTKAPGHKALTGSYAGWGVFTPGSRQPTTCPSDQ